MSHRRYLITLGIVFSVVLVVSAINSSHLDDWLLENVLVALFVPALILSYRWFVFSRFSMTLIFLFLCLHEVGAHYTYAEVPYDDWITAITGWSLNEAMGWERNQFDRFVHFCYGLLLAHPIREVFLRIANVRGFWGYFLPLDLTMSTSMIYELIEWAAAELFAGDLGMAYLGTQGDVWDAQRDMALASLGALIAMSVTMLLNLWLQRDFSREWVESLRVKGAEPLGENAIAKHLNGRR